LVDAAQITLFRERLVFEIKERGTFEREHGEGTFQDIRCANKQSYASSRLPARARQS
jgi:hypothetical protein